MSARVEPESVRARAAWCLSTGRGGLGTYWSERDPTCNGAIWRAAGANGDRAFIELGGDRRYLGAFGSNEP